MTDALIDVFREPTPCDDCTHVRACAQRKLSCHSFAVYAVGGLWRRFPREPTRGSYDQLFAVREDADLAPGPGAGPRSATLAKFKALLALSGKFDSLHAALFAVRLNPSHWQTIVARYPELATHVRSLVSAR